MSEYTVWHNPSCSKSRGARDELAGLGADVTLRLYRDDPPTPVELAEVLDKLGAQPWDVCRLKEKKAVELGLADWGRDDSTRDDWIAAMCGNPILIERPIVIRGDRAVVARRPGWREALVGGHPTG